MAGVKPTFWIVFTLARERSSKGHPTLLLAAYRPTSNHRVIPLRFPRAMDALAPPSAKFQFFRIVHSPMSKVHSTNINQSNSNLVWHQTNISRYSGDPYWMSTSHDECCFGTRRFVVNRFYRLQCNCSWFSGLNDWLFGAVGDRSSGEMCLSLVAMDVKCEGRLSMILIV